MTLPWRSSRFDQAAVYAVGGATTVTAPNGMSWTFPGVVTHGTYVNGDVWVYTTTTLPMPTLSTPATGTGASARNGGMINPTFNTLVEKSTADGYTTAMQQGFDGRATENASTPGGPYPVCLDYNDAYNAHISVSTLSPGDSLVSCESLNQTEYDAIAFYNSNVRALWRMAVLTVVNYTPNADEFRPPYYGTTKTRRRFSELNLALLPNRAAAFNPKGVGFTGFHIDDASVYFAAADTALPVLTRIQEMEVNSCEHVQWFLTPHKSSRSTFSLLSAATNMYWYPRDRGVAWGQLACYVLHNFSDRDIFLARLVQIAIDAYPVATGFSGATPFANGAGFFVTPLWLIRFAGLLFNDTGMKNAASISTGKTDYFGDPIYKWGEQTRTFFKSGAYAGYRLPTGYSGLTPLFGDTPFQDNSATQGTVGSNGTFRYPSLIYDVYPYREVSAEWYGTVTANSADGTTIKLNSDTGGLPNGYFNGRKICGILDGTEYETTITTFTAATQVCVVSPAFPIAPDNNDKFLIRYAGYPNILANSYTDLPDPNSPGCIGTYMSGNQQGHMGLFIASVAMADEAFWGGNGSVAAFDRRYANDPQMWEGWGRYFDYATDFSTGDGLYRRDWRGLGGSGNGWMCALWDELVIIPSSIPIGGQTITPIYSAAAAITASSLPIGGQTITPVLGAGGGPTTVFDRMSFDSATDGSEPGWSTYNGRQIIGAANLSAASGQYAKVTLGFAILGTSATIIAYIGQGSTGGTAYDTTAMTQLTGGDFGSGTYTHPAFSGNIRIVSGWVLLNEAYDEAKDLVVAVFGDAAAVAYYHSADANNALWYRGLPNDGMNPTHTGTYTLNGSFTQTVVKIEIQP